MNNQVKTISAFILAGPPALWMAQMSVSEIIASEACYPHTHPLSAPTWSGLPHMLTAINILCLIGAIVLGFLARKAWRENPKEVADGLSPSGSREKFLTMLAMMTSFLFIVAVIFTACANLLVSPCTDWY